MTHAAHGAHAHMEQRVSIVTLGVSDLARARRFYETLGWRGQETEETVFFQAGGLAVVLWSREKLAADSGWRDAGRPGTFGGMVLAQNVRSPAEVDALVTAAEEAGATVTRQPSETFYGGYAGVFTDPDGHSWEIAHNPGFTLTADGSLVLPDFGTGTAAGTPSTPSTPAPPGPGGPHPPHRDRPPRGDHDGRDGDGRPR